MLINNQAHPPKRTGHTHHAQEPSTPPSRALRHTGRNALPIPRQAYIPHHTQHTHKTPLTAAAQPALSRGISQRHSLGQTPMPAKPRTPPQPPEPSMRQAHTGPRAIRGVLRAQKRTRT